MIGVSLKNKKEMSLNNYKEYLNPKYIYIPYTKEDKILVKDKDIVSMGDKIGIYKNNLSIISSISGQISILDNYIKVKNNNKEKQYKECNYNYTKEEFINLLKEKGICGMSITGFPTYLKYQCENINTLIINAVECDPYISSDYLCTIKYTLDIIKTIDIIMNIFKIDECFIAISGKNPLLKEKILTCADEYKHIKVAEVPPLYPMGWEKSLVRYLKHVDYNKYPIEKGIIVNNISTIYAISEAINYDKPLIDRIVTFSGEGIKKPCNIKVKIGTKIGDILKYLGGTYKNVRIVKGGVMMGNIASLDEVILATTNSVLALPKLEAIELPCIKCGKCSNNCPSKLSPILIKQNKDNLKALKYLNPKDCIECGICSYICPSKIDICADIIETKEKLKEINK
jgi:electron transport complex protein RnfC